MSWPRQSKKEQVLAGLLEEVRSLKQDVDARQQGINELQAALHQFEAQYLIYARTLQRRRNEIERNIQLVRFQIRHLREPGVKAPASAESEADEAPGATFQDASAETAEIGPLQIAEDPTERSKVTARNFFAKFWHPDSGATADLSLMHQLNTAFKDSRDVADMLAAVPWSDVWLRSADNESIGLQIERLSDWCDALRLAHERLDGTKSALQQHEFYEIYQEKRSADQLGEDYFAQLAVRERNEIARLEQSLAILQAQLDELKHSSAGVQTDG